MVSKANDVAKAVLSEFPWWTAAVGSCVDRFALSIESVVQIHDQVVTFEGVVVG